MSAEPFRIALSAGFKQPDGSMTYPSFDLTEMEQEKSIQIRFLTSGDPIQGDELEDVDALILLSEKFTAQSMPASGRLSIVARFGVGYDTVDVEACTKNSIAVCITPDGVRRPVAVSILTLLLSLTGKLLTKDRLVRSGPAGFAARSDHMGVGLVNRTLGSIGMGNIGAEMFRLAEPFGMRFIAFDPFADTSLASDLGVDLVNLDKVFAQSDVLAINCPLNTETHHLVNAERLAAMKPTAFLINTARGPIVDQVALTEALQEGSLAGAALDVFEIEPPDVKDPLLSLDNVILTPHALCWTDQCFAGIGAADVASVLDLRAGRLPVGLVNPEVAKLEGFQQKIASYGTKAILN